MADHHDMSELKNLPADIDLALLALPIRPANLAALTAIRIQVAALAKDRDDWRRHFELYAASWLRNLGGRIFNKRHRIDAFAMTTEHHRKGYERALAAGLIGEAYGSGPRTPPKVELRPDDDDLFPHLPESINAAKRCGIQRSSWMTGWFVPWSPRNDNENAEGLWSDWVKLAEAIIAADKQALAALIAGNATNGGQG